MHPTVPAGSARAAAPPHIWTGLAPRVALASILALSAGLNLFRLGTGGIPNTYYGAAVLSMLKSWHNTFFVAFDPSGFVTIDKPPLGFWMQTLSARMLGFSGLSLLLPEAIAGICSVALVYLIVRRAFGVAAGLLAALVMALMPINVATDRNNTIDSLLQLALLLAAWAVLRAAETARLRWLVATAVLLGLGFNIKMLEAYVVVPAFVVVYLVTAPTDLRTRLGHLALAALVLVGVSFAWPVAVDLTPPDQRPWVGSTQDNSELSLILGYNGLQRVFGSRFVRAPRPTASAAATGTGLSDALADFTPGGGGQAGSPGPLRLIDQELAGQVSWLLPLAALGVLMAGRRRWQARTRLDRAARSFVLWSAWVAVTAIVFSAAGELRAYYLVTMTPAIAALVGIGIVSGWRAYRGTGPSGALLPCALGATALLQLFILRDYADWMARLGPFAAIGALLAVVLFASRWTGWANGRARWLVGSAVAALLVAPTTWATMPLLAQGAVARTPAAGPQTGRPDVAARSGGARPDRVEAAGGEPTAQEELLAFLEANRNGAPYLAATTNASLAAPLVLATGEPVMALGGFIGRDPILTVDELATKVRAGEVRFFLLVGPTGGRGRAGGSGGATDNTSWVTANCSLVPPDSWGGPAAANSDASFGFVPALYDCRALAG